MWDRPVSHARFVEAKRAEALERLGLCTVGDLIGHWPFRYVDLSAHCPLGQLRAGAEVTVVGTVRAVQLKRPRQRLTVVEVALGDETGAILGVWFNQPWMADRFTIGERVAFAGMVELDYGMLRMVAPFVERLDGDDSPGYVGRILPVHRTTEGLSVNWLRRIIASAVDDYGDVPDFLPVDVRTRNGLLSLRAAIRGMHFPSSVDEALSARKRLAFDELFCLQVGLAQRKHGATVSGSAFSHVLDGRRRALMREATPFALTVDQCAAIDEIADDLASPVPMHRLLLGDVGTGKTIVAADALAIAADSGTQAVMMAPTEVLAVQYAEKLAPLLDAAGIPWVLLTGSLPSAERSGARASIATGAASVVFGTHAVIEEDVAFYRLTIAIVDEQHRFGVRQRLALRAKGESVDMLVMTATPIPRSLALTVFGDLDVTYLRERPQGDAWRPATTTRVRKSERKIAYDTVRAEVRAGRQAYVVCPLIDESDATAAASVYKEAERLASGEFAELRIGVLTGRSPAAERLDTMRRFKSGQIDVLVCTTVIEVGVDVPNATVMIIEGADRFGLAQLHQLRGRVGRGAHPGHVFLFTDSSSRHARGRIDALCASHDGFHLAEEDLRLRGPGQVLGEAQHGLLELRIASLTGDELLLDLARRDAFALVARDPTLIEPVNVPLQVEVERRMRALGGWCASG